MLRPPDGIVVHQYHLVRVAGQDGEGQLAHLPGRERVHRYAADLGVHRPPGAQCLGECRRALRLHPHHPGPARIPGRDAAEQAAPADAGQNARRVRCLFGQLEPERAGAEHGFGLVVCVDGERAGAGDPLLAGRQSLGIAGADHDQFRAIVPDAGDLGGRGDVRDVDPRRDAEGMGGEGDGGAVVAARRCHDPGLGDVPEQQVRERAAGLERPAVLELLELEHQRPGRQPEFGPVHRDRRRAPHVGPDQRLNGADSLAGHDREDGRCRWFGWLCGRRLARGSRGAHVVTQPAAGRPRQTAAAQGGRYGELSPGVHVTVNEAWLAPETVG